MAAELVHSNQSSSSFCGNNDVCLNHECQCCSLLKSDVQFLSNELNSMTEIINILNEELKYDSTTEHDQKANSVGAKKPMVTSSQCSNCLKLENQLKETLNNLSTMKLILEILNKEIKPTRSTLHIGYNTNNSWVMAKTNSLPSSTYIQPSKSKRSTHGIQAAYQYAVPVANRYTVLSSYQELQESKDEIPPSNMKQLSTFKTGNNYKHIKGLHKKENTAMYQPRLSVTYPINITSKNQEN